MLKMPKSNLSRDRDGLAGKAPKRAFTGQTWSVPKPRGGAHSLEKDADLFARSLKNTQSRNTRGSHEAR